MTWTLCGMTRNSSEYRCNCHDLDFGVVDATSGLRGNRRQVTPICMDASWMDLASATWGGELHLPRCTMSIISETDNGVHLQ